MTVVGRFFTPPEQSFFLLGPRGTGKSTWLRQRLPQALFINLLEPAIYRELSARPERLQERWAAAPGRDIVIDEVQRLPELLHVVHDLMERDTSRRFILTGSSARKLVRRGGVDLLAGRALRQTMHPFMASELPAFELARALEIGMVPLVVSAPSPARTLASYAALYLKEEVQGEGLTRNIGAFSRFLETVSFSHGAVVNVSEIAREAEIGRKTVAAYLEILEDSLLAFQLPVFTKRAKRKTIVHPKLYFFDVGVYRSLRPKGPLDRPEEIAGAALEGLVAQHLRAWIAYSENGCQLYFWRTRTGSEVDFIVYGEPGLFAIEVKNTAAIRQKDLRALRTFRGDYPIATGIFLYRGKDARRIDGIWCVPVDQFLMALRPGHGLMPQLA